MSWYLKVLRQYADFHGRARRTEFWMFVLVSTIIAAVLQAVDYSFGFGGGYRGAGSHLGIGTFVGGGGPLFGIYSLAVLCPTIAVNARRLHDIGRSGWWQLLGLIPIIGWIICLVWFVTPGTRGINLHGPDPKPVAPATTATPEAV